jgi:hypothetical protein
MKWSAALAAVVLAGAAAYVYAHREKSAQTAAAPEVSLPVASNRNVEAAVGPGVKTNSVPAAGLTGASESNATSKEPTVPPPGVSGALFFGGPQSTPVNIASETLIENTRTAIRNYGSRFGGNPVGTNPEITAALNGDNPGGVKFLDPEQGMRINGKGELVDPWGTPLFFHQLSGTETEIRSAGPDKQMWTQDDLVSK